MPTNAQKRNFLRLVYANGADQTARTAFLNGLNAKASASLATGKTLTGASGAGVTSQYELIAGHDPADIAELVDWAFDHIGADNITDALAALQRHGATLIHTSFAGLRA